jgi:energy-coupling factor transport system substrate-specific component
MNLSEPMAAVTPATHPAIDKRRLGRLLSMAIFVLASLLGVMAFASPFFMPLQQGAQAGANSPAYLAGLIVLCLAALMAEAQGQAMSAKRVALLGVLVAINAALRFAENAIPGPAGFSPVFMLIIIAGAVFGARFGFLMGALTILVSALITGGVGPWLPYQMFAAGWMGMSAAILRTRASEKVRRGESEKGRNPTFSLFPLLPFILFSAAWGFLYGAIMNLWSWPFQAGDPAQSWQAGLSFIDGVKRYLAFYVVTSLWWDVFAAAGNVLLIVLFGLPTLKVLMRFKARFLFETGD